jgi:hypothetical protein
MITELAGLNIMSFLLTLSSYYFPVQRMVVFAPSVIAIYVFTMLAEYILLVYPPQFGRIIRTCINVAEDGKVAWVKELVAYTCLIFTLTGMWLFLWLRRGRWVRTIEETRNSAADRSEFETRAVLFQTLQYSKLVWVVGVCAMLMSMTMAGVAAYRLDNIMRGRRGMILISDGETGENLWGVGQIAALFAWAPLLVELGYNAVYGGKPYFTVRPPLFIKWRS